VPVVYLALAYLLAAVPFALVVTTLFGDGPDVRESGSRNIGATNVKRLYGWELAVPVLLLDMAKGFVPVALAQLLWPEFGLWWPALVAATAFLGHCYPVYLEFHGGKGVATGAGALLAVTPGPTSLAALTWAAVLLLTGRSSVAALTACLALVGLVWWLDEAALPVALVLGLGIAWTHLANIRRLIRGEEAQVVRPVRWRRSPDDGPTAVDVLSQTPSGSMASVEAWPGIVDDAAVVVDDGPVVVDDGPVVVDDGPVVVDDAGEE
jgi:glycerol-3-phosphate acyltransferase PlsY